MIPRPVTETEKSEMRRLRAAGVPYTQIVERTGRSLSTIHRYIADIPVAGKKPVRGKAITPQPPKELDLKGLDLSNKEVSAASEASEAVSDTAVTTEEELEPVSIVNAPLNWQRHWFATPMSRRDSIEEHLAQARVHLATLKRLDVTDPTQHNLWGEIRANSPYSIRALSRAIDIPHNNIAAYENAKRTPKGSRVRMLYQAGLWNILAGEYHHHLLSMMWHTYWAENDEDAPPTITATTEFIEWTSTLDSHPLFIDLQPGVAYNPNVAWPPAA